MRTASGGVDIELAGELTSLGLRRYSKNKGISGNKYNL